MNSNMLQDTTFSLGSFLRDRRSRLKPDPKSPGQRRTPGLRREEVAARAAVSVTWYTWLEQGRGGPPSDEVLERLARALELGAAGREILFLLAQQRPPPITRISPSQVGPALQRVLQAMPTSLAYVRTLTWDILSWNAAAALLTQMPEAPSEERNVLKRLFYMPAARHRFPEWESEARFCLGAFRLDLARTGGSPEAAALVAELQANSPDFRRLWADSETRLNHAHLRRIQHPVVGSVTLECMSFAVDSEPGLSLLVHTPVSQADEEAIALLLAMDGQAPAVLGPAEQP